MDNFEIRILDRVEIRVDDMPLRLPAQEAKALSVLVAAHRPVHRDTMVSAIWGADETAREKDRLSPVISRLRYKLAKGRLGISMSRESHSYWLTAEPQDDLPAFVDAYRFEARLRKVLALVVDGRVDEAWRAYPALAARWSGEPFAQFGADWDAPSLVAEFRAKLAGLRGELVARLAQAALLHGRYDWLDALTGHPIASGLPEADTLWLLKLLVVLRRDGVPAADAELAALHQRKGDSSLADRAFDLIALHESGFDVHRPLAEPVPATGPVPAGPVPAGPVPAGPVPAGPAPAGSDPVGAVPAGSDAVGAVPAGSVLAGPVVDAAAVGSGLRPLLDRIAGGLCGAVVVRDGAGERRRALLAALIAGADTRGVPVVRVSCRDLDDLYPWRIVTGLLWAHVRRDLSTGAPVAAVRKAIVDFVAVTAIGALAPQGQHRTPAELVALLEMLLQQVVRAGGLIVAFDEAHLLSPVARDVLAGVRGRFADRPLGIVLIGSHEGDWHRTIETGPGWLPPFALPSKVAVAGPPAVQPTTGVGGAAWPWLAAAAVTSTGGDIDTTLVADVLELGFTEADRAVAEAVASGAIRLDGGPRLHDSWRERILDELAADPSLSRHLHRRAYDALLERARSAQYFDPALPVRIARHALAARPLVGDGPAAQACLQAARAERRAYSVAAAVVWAEQGLALACPQETRVDLLITLGDAHNDSGAMAEAAAHYRTAYEAAEGHPELQAVAAILLARQWSDPGQVDERLLYLLRRTLGALAAVPGPAAAALHLQLSAHVAHKTTMAVGFHADPASGSGRPGPELARSTLARLAPDDDPAVRCEVLTECRWGLYDFAPPRELLGLAERLREASAAAKSSFFESEALVALAIDQLRLGRMGAVRLTVHQHRVLITQYPRPLGQWLQSALECLLDLWMGRFDAAAQWLFGPARATVDELQESLAVPAGTLAQTWDGQVYWLLRELGRTEELFAQGLADRVEDNGYFPIWTASLILALCDTGRFDMAADRLSAFLIEHRRLAEFPPHGWAVPTLAILAEAAVQLQEAGTDGVDEGLISLLRQKLDVHADELALAGWPAVLMGPVARYSGILALAQGDVPSALDHLERATSLVGESGPMLARVRHDHARALLRAGERDLAATLLRRARASAEQLGMTTLAKSIDTLQSAHGLP